MVRGEFLVTSISSINLVEIFHYEDAEVWYKAKVSYVSEDVDSGKEKRITNQFLVSAHNIKESYERIEESLKGLMVSFEIDKIEVTKFVEIFPYVAMEGKELVTEQTTTLQIDAGVRYWEDSSVDNVDDVKGDLIPCRDGDRWKPLIDVESGLILNWKVGTTAKIHYKICDDGIYTLTEINGTQSMKDGYVPDCLAIDDTGFGDYIIMDIDKNGLITNWEFDITEFKARI